MNKLKSIIWTSLVITIMLGCSIICAAEEIETTVPETTTVVEETTTVEPETTTVYVKGNVEAYIKKITKKKMTVSVSTYHKKTSKKIKVAGYQVKVFQYGKKKTVATKNFNVTKKSNKLTIKKKFKENTLYYCKIRYFQKSGKKKVYSKWKKTDSCVNVNAKKLKFDASISNGKLNIKFNNIKGATGAVEIDSPSLAKDFDKSFEYYKVYNMKKNSKKTRSYSCSSVAGEKITSSQVYGISIRINQACNNYGNFYFDSNGKILSQKKFGELVFGY